MGSEREVKVISIDEYKANPCRVSSVPYWKMITIKKPDNIALIHDADYIAEQNYQGIDTTVPPFVKTNFFSRLS
jgi:hypothetical protein